MTDDTYPKPPDLQEWVERYGGYNNIPWAEWDAAVTQYQIDRRAWLGGPLTQEEARKIQKRKSR